ncbi:MAG: ATP-binding protein [Acidimicrobiia bacterium]
MQLSPASSSRWARFAPGVVLCSGAVCGLLAEWWAGGFDNGAVWATDYLTGIGLLAAAVGSMRLNKGTAGLLMASAAAWWLGTLAPGALYLHRIPLFHVIAAYPGWRPSSKFAGMLLATTYVAVAIPAISGSDAGTAAYGLAIVGMTSWRFIRATSSSRRHRRIAFLASLVLFMGTTGGALFRLVLSGSPRAAIPTTLIYEAMTVLAGLLLWSGLRRPSVESLADLVVELDESSVGSLRDELRRLLDDPRLEIGFRTEGDRYVTAVGVPVDLPDPDSERVATLITRDGHGELVIVHDRSSLQSEDLMAAVESVKRLSRANATLLAETRDRLQHLAESRQRLLAAEEEERLRLSDDLRNGVEARLESLEHKLRVAVDRATSGETRNATHRALSQLQLTRQDLRAIADGLHPQAFAASLADGLRTLVGRLSLPVELALPPNEVPANVRPAIYYLSAEALSNVVKHARARRVALTVTIEEDSVVLVVEDDGVGGADASRGSGLNGLADRVAALGGRFEMTSPIGGGTRLVAEIPLGDQSVGA